MAQVKVRALLSLAGKFNLPHDAGKEFEIDEKLGKHIVEAKYGEYVTDKPAKPVKAKPVKAKPEIGADKPETKE